MVHRHQLNGQPGEDARSAVHALAQHHLPEGKHVVDGRGESSRASLEFRWSREQPVPHLVQHDQVRLGEVRSVAGWKSVELLLRHVEAGVPHPERLEEAFAQE